MLRQEEKRDDDACTVIDVRAIKCFLLSWFPHLASFLAFNISVFSRFQCEYESHKHYIAFSRASFLMTALNVPRSIKPCISLLRAYRISRRVHVRPNFSVPPSCGKHNHQDIWVLEYSSGKYWSIDCSGLYYLFTCPRLNGRADIPPKAVPWSTKILWGRPV